VIMKKNVKINFARAWLSMIGYRKLIVVMKKDAKSRLPDIDAVFGSDGPMDQHQLDEEFTSEEVAQLKEEVQRLPECEKIAVAAKLLNPKLTCKQLGELLGVSHDTANKRYNSGIEMLRTALRSRSGR